MTPSPAPLYVLSEHLMQQSLRICSVCKMPFPRSSFLWKRDGQISIGKCLDCRKAEALDRTLRNIQARCDAQRLVYESLPEADRPLPKICANPFCDKAGQMQPPENFRVVKSTFDRLSVFCRLCKRKTGNSLTAHDPKVASLVYKKASTKHNSALSMQWQKDNPSRAKETSRRHDIKKYGITPEQYNSMFAKQNGQCAICGATAEGYRLHIDHDHNCCEGKKRCCGKCVRGLLCAACNIKLGILEQPEWSKRARVYLKKYPLKDESGNDQPTLFDGLD